MFPEAGCCGDCVPVGPLVGLAVVTASAEQATNIKSKATAQAKNRMLLRFRTLFIIILSQDCRFAVLPEIRI